MEQYEIAQCSLQGNRNEQQDRSAVVKESNLLAVICDGMGGMCGGAAAAQTAVNELAARFKTQKPDDIPKFFLKNAEQINAAVNKLPAKGGTTMVSVIIKGNELYWFSVGDSRLYLLRDNTLYQITEDHNYFLQLKEQLASGKITNEYYNSELEKGHSLISALGMKKIPRVHMNIKPYSLKSSDILLLTSDGLYKALSDQIIKELLVTDIDHSKELIKEQLIKCTNGDLDNTTYIIIKYISREEAL